MTFCLFTFAFCLLTCLSSHAAEVYLGLQAYGGGGKMLGVGVASFVSKGDAGAEQAATLLHTVLREDLLFERLFNIVEGGPSPAEKIDSLVWSGLTAQVVVSGDVTQTGDQVTLECRIYDVGTGKVLWGKSGTGPRTNMRRLAHLMADQITYQLSGQPGIAHTQIAFVNNKTRHKEIFVMDYDGANLRQLTHHNSIVLLPKYSPDGKQIAFNSYRAANPDAYLIDAAGGGLKDLSSRQGLNTAPNWAPDGQTLALTLSRGGDPDLYLINKAGAIIRRLTYSPGVDTSPSFSPNGQQIAFISDRSGSPELYVMDVTGANVQRLTYGQWVDSPAWSPRGDLIAYERQRSQGRYDIWLIEPSGKNARVISEAGVRNEHPTWSPDGRFLAYTSDREGKLKICTMGADGSSPHCLGDAAGQSSMPTWSN
jgi:TolB protein